MVKKKEVIVSLDPNEAAIGELTLGIKGRTPLIMHRMSEKIRKQMLDKQKGKSTGKKPPKNPERDMLSCIHWIGTPAKTIKDIKKCRVGFPAGGFRAGAVRAAKLCKDSTMKDAWGAFWIIADHVSDTPLVEITHKGAIMREDPVPIHGTWDIRHRPEFKVWGATLRIEFNYRLVTPQSLVTWFKLAGRSIGVGEWRITGKMTGGEYGAYDVVSAKALVPDLEEKVL